MANDPTAPGATPDPAANRRPRIYYGYWIVGASMVAWFATVGTQTPISGVFMKPMTEELGWTRSEFISAMTVGQFLMAFTGFFIGAYVDRNGARALMVVGVTLAAMSMFLISAVTELWQWVLLRGVLSSVGSALMGNLVVNVTLAKWFVEKRGTAISYASMGVPLGIGIFPPLMTALVDEFGWRTGWRLMAMAVWALIYPVAMIMRRSPEDYELHPDGKSDDDVRKGGGAVAAADYANSFTRREALRTPALYLTVLAFGLSSVSLGGVLMQAIPFLTDEGFDRTFAALMMTAYAVTSWGGKPAWGFLLDRTTPRYLATFAFSSQAVAVVLVMLGGSTGSLPVVVIGFLVFGIGGGGAIPLQEVIWASYFGRRYLGEVRGVGLPLSLTLSASAPIGASYYFDTVGNYYGAFLVATLSTTLAAFVILLSKKPQKPGQGGNSDTTPVSPESGTFARQQPSKGNDEHYAPEDATAVTTSDVRENTSAIDATSENEPLRNSEASPVSPPQRRAPRDYMHEPPPH